MRFAGSILLVLLVAPLLACDGSVPAKQPICGDGFVDPDEQCDDGQLFEHGACRPGCIAAACGDGVVGPGEACDDGNNLDGDGCSYICEVRRDELWRANTFTVTAMAATDDGLVVGHYLFPEDVAAGKPLLEWLDRDGQVVASVAASGFAEGVIEPQRLAVGEGGTVAIVGGWRPSQSELASQAFVVAARPGQLLWTKLNGTWREDVGLVWASVSMHRDGVAVAGTELAFLGGTNAAPSFVTALYDAADGHERWYHGVDAPELFSLTGNGVLAHADGTISAAGHGDGVPLVVRWSASGEQLATTTTPLDFQEIIQLGVDRAGGERATLGFWDGSTYQKSVARVDANGMLSDVQPVASFGYPEFTSDGRVLCTELDDAGFESHLVLVDPLDHTRTVRPLGVSINRVSVLGTRLYVATNDLYGDHIRAIDLSRAP